MGIRSVSMAEQTVGAVAVNLPVMSSQSIFLAVGKYLLAACWIPMITAVLDICYDVVAHPLESSGWCGRIGRMDTRSKLRILSLVCALKTIPGCIEW